MKGKGVNYAFEQYLLNNIGRNGNPNAVHVHLLIVKWLYISEAPYRADTLDKLCKMCLLSTLVTVVSVILITISTV